VHREPGSGPADDGRDQRRLVAVVGPRAECASRHLRVKDLVGRHGLARPQRRRSAAPARIAWPSSGRRAVSHHERFESRLTVSLAICRELGAYIDIAEGLQTMNNWHFILHHLPNRFEKRRLPRFTCKYVEV
jgi:hypothetical protein